MTICVSDIEIDRLFLLIEIEHLLRDPTRALELASYKFEPLIGRNARLSMAKGIGRRHARGIERIEHGNAIGLFMDFERAPDVEAVMVEMKSCDIAAEEAFEPAVLAEDETAHS